MCCIVLADLGWLWCLPQWSVSCPCHSMIAATWSLVSLQSPVSGCFEIYFIFFCINFPCVMWYLYYYIRKMIAFAPDIPFSIILNFLCGFPPCYAYANGCSRQPQTRQEVIPMDGCIGRVFAQLTFGVKQWGNMPEAGGEMKNWRVWRTVVTQQVSKSFGNISSSDSSLQRGNKPLQPAVSAPDWLVGR